MIKRNIITWLLTILKHGKGLEYVSNMPLKSITLLR